MLISELDRLVNNAKKGVDTLQKYDNFLEFLGRGNIVLYPTGNMFAIYAQRPDAVSVRSAKKWRESGRRVAGTGIAVYDSYAINSKWNKFSDTYFDVSDTKGDTPSKTWNPSKAEINALLNYYVDHKEATSSNLDNPSSVIFQMFYNRTGFYLNAIDISLKFSEDINVRDYLQFFIAYSCTKVLCARVGVFYTLSANDIELLEYCFTTFIKPGEEVDTAFLSNVMDAVHFLGGKELNFVFEFTKKERRNNNDLSGEIRVDRRGSVRDGRSEAEVFGERNPGNGSRSGNTESSDYLKYRESEETGIEHVGVQDSRLSGRELSGRTGDDGIREHSARVSGDEDRGSEGLSGEHDETVEGEVQRVQDGLAEQSEERSGDRFDSNGVRESDSLQTSGRSSDGAVNEVFNEHQNTADVSVDTSVVSDVSADTSDVVSIDISDETRDLSKIFVSGLADTGNIVAASYDNGVTFEQTDIFSFFEAKRQADLEGESLLISDDENTPTTFTFIGNTIDNKTVREIILAGTSETYNGGKYEVFNYYSYHWDDLDKENAIYHIKSAYKGTCLGFNVNGRNISAYYDGAKGLLLAYGNECRNNPLITVSWEQIEDIIHDLVASNDYISKSQAEYADKFNKNILDNVVFYFTDGFEVDNSFYPEPIRNVGHIFPNVTDAIQDYISDPVNGATNAKMIIDMAHSLMDMYKAGEINGVFRYALNSRAIDDFEGYVNGRYAFDLKDSVDVIAPTFIPNDVIDIVTHVFSSDRTGEHYQMHKRFEMYLESDGGRDDKQLVKMLKSLYGLGGCSGGIIDYDYNANGFSVKMRIHEKSGKELTRDIPFTEIAKRFCNYMRSDSFFLPGEEEQYESWKAFTQDFENSKINFDLEREDRRDSLPSITYGNGYVDHKPTLISSSDVPLIVRAAAERLLNHPAVAFYRDSIIECIKSDRTTEEKEQFIDEIFSVDLANTVFHLTDYDFIKHNNYGNHVDYINVSGNSSNYNCFSFYGFAEHYIDSNAWFGYKSILNFTVEQLVDGLIAVINPLENKETVSEDAVSEVSVISDKVSRDYGYVSPEMVNINRDHALMLYDYDISVYLLYNDGTESLAEHREDIENFDGIFGVESSDWTAYTNVLASRAVIMEFKSRTLDFIPHAESIEADVLSYINDMFAENEISAKVINLAIHGSRSRGLNRDDSDLDVVVEIESDLPEDSLFDLLNNAEEPLEFNGIRVDINPIKADKTGTLAEYLESAEAYLNDLREQRANVNNESAADAAESVVNDAVSDTASNNVQDNASDNTSTNVSDNSLSDSYAFYRRYEVTLTSDAVEDGSWAIYDNEQNMYHYDTDGTLLTFNSFNEGYEYLTRIHDEYVRNASAKNVSANEASEASSSVEDAESKTADSNGESLNDLLDNLDIDYIREELKNSDAIADEMVAQALDIAGPDNVTDNLSDNEVFDAQNLPSAVDFTYNPAWRATTGSTYMRGMANIEAIRVLKTVEAQKRPATPEEQEILSHYLGWGGLPEWFDESKNASNYALLKGLLTDEEYSAARATVTDAFYTPREVIESVFETLKRFGFENGNILEPAMGIGNFFSAMPQDMKAKSRLYGVEVDSISGRIAKLLHPSANILICGVENAVLPENFYDVVIGNVPFGDFGVSDPKFNNKNFLIHDYFFAKALALCAPNGIVAFITSKGTLDKKNSSVRRYISEKADFIGAVRLPNTTFAASANTEATSDIIFLQKKAVPSIQTQEFESTEIISIGDYNVPLNSYFVSHPDYMLGHMKADTGRFGDDKAITYLVPNLNTDLSADLNRVINKLPANIYKGSLVSEDDETDNEKEVSIPADPSVKNYTYTLIDGDIYYRENSLMVKCDLSDRAAGAVKALCGIRDSLHHVINGMLDNCSDDELRVLQAQLNERYDAFLSSYGNINDDKGAARYFADDVENSLVASLEVLNDDKTYSKADIFTKRTIKPYIKVESADNALDALNITVADLGYVDIENILRLYPCDFDTLLEELSGEIYLNPMKADRNNPYAGYETKEEYLSGDVRKKLKEAQIAVETNTMFNSNVAALVSVIPKDLDATDISFKFGVTWIDVEDYENFMYDVFSFYYYQQQRVKIEFNKYTNEYSIRGKSSVNNVKTKDTYGTDRISGLDIMENLLNQKQIAVYDTVENADGSARRVLNVNATTIAKSKADVLKEDFQNWIINNNYYRDKYITRYNEIFNSLVLRNYDGSSLSFPNSNPVVELRPHQKNAVARIIRGGNTLLAHCVGAGKSYEMCAGAMELKRLGFANKPLIVVPNHLTGQMAGEFLNLYPNANVLLTTKRDFEKKNRRRFISKIATGEYDAVIMGHSQFERIKLSQERQERNYNRRIDELEDYLRELKMSRGNSWSIKNMERSLKSERAALERLRNDKINDDVISFEELGVDALFIDEAHNYKNLRFKTSMSNVAGINSDGSKKASDLYDKIEYINELSPGRNVVFATGTPVSNTMCEMYVMQKFLSNDLLREKGIDMFDAWAANFGETVTAMELAPEGTGYKPKTRFAKFTNLPELVTLFRNFADVKMQDDIQLDIPTLAGNKYDIIEIDASPEIKEYMQSFLERAERVRNRGVSPDVDNMLKICHDAKFLSTDVRMLDPTAPPDYDSKLYKVCECVYKVWVDTAEQKGAQVIFSDIGTPGADKEKSGKFCVYQFIKDELVRMGIPENEICFIHDAKDDKAKDEMFTEVNNGSKRVIIGSTSKLGTGTNIQKRLAALHEVDVPWKPAEVEQREGRILRQGNMFKEVHIFRYVTKGTFDAYNWGIIENKQKFISQVMTSGNVDRECTDVDDTVLNYAQMKAAASDNPLIREKMEVDAEVTRLELIKKSYTGNRIRLMDECDIKLPQRKEKLEKTIMLVTEDLSKRNDTQLYKDYLVYMAKREAAGEGSSVKHESEQSEQVKNEDVSEQISMFEDVHSSEQTAKENDKPVKFADKSPFEITLGGIVYDDRNKAGEYIMSMFGKIAVTSGEVEIGNYMGFTVSIYKELGMLNDEGTKLCIKLGGAYNYIVEASKTSTGLGTVIRLENAIKKLDEKLDELKLRLYEINNSIIQIKGELEKPFSHEEELSAALARQAELNDILYKPDEQENIAPENQDKCENPDAVSKSADVITYGKIVNEVADRVAEFMDTLNGSKKNFKRT